MTNLLTIPLQDDFETTLSGSWSGGTGTVSVNDTPTGTMPSGGYSYIVVNPGESNMQVAKIDGWDGTGKTFNVTSISVKKGTGVDYSAQTHAANSVVRFSNNFQFRYDLQQAINSKLDSTALGNFTITGSGIDSTGSMTFSDDETAPVTLKELAEGNGADQYFAISENDTTVGHFEDKVTFGDGIKGTKVNPGANEQMDIDIDTTDTTVFVKTSSGAADENKVPVLDAAGKLNNFVEISSLANLDWLAGEDLIQGNSIFVEETVTFASATNSQNIGDVTANTRVAIKAVGSGVASSTLKLALAKVSSPSVNIGIRIETDNAGSPSGTLVDANATATVLASALTTSLVDTTATLAGSITIPRGTKVRIVVFAGTYGSETVNGTNYFKIGYKEQQTSTRYNKLWNGSSWSYSLYSGTNIADTITSASWGGYATNGYIEFTPKYDLYFKTTSMAGSGLSSCTIESNGNIIATGSIVSQTATFNIILTKGTQYRLNFILDNHSAYFSPTNSDTNITVGTTSGIHNSHTINTEILNSNQYYIYISSSLFETSLLSKTDASYAHKLPDMPRIATETKNIGNTVKYDFQGITKVLSGLTKDSVYYISNTPGVVSTSAGTNIKLIGEAKYTNGLLLGSINFPLMTKVTGYGPTGTGYFTITIPIGSNFNTVLMGISYYARRAASPSYGATLGLFGYFVCMGSGIKFKPLSAVISSNDYTAPISSYGTLTYDDSNFITTEYTQTFDANNRVKIKEVYRSGNNLCIVMAGSSSSYDSFKTYDITPIIVIN